MSEFRAAVVPGRQRALAVRRGEVVLLLTPSGEDSIDRALIDIVREAAASASIDRGRQLGRRLLELLVGLDGGELPGYGAAAVTDDGIAVMVHGDVVVSWSSSRGAEQLSSTDALSGWVDRVIPGPVDELCIACSSDRHESPHPRSDLRDGVVPADAVLLDRWADGQPGEPDELPAVADRPVGPGPPPAPDGPVTTRFARPSGPADVPIPVDAAVPAAAQAGHGPADAVIFDLGSDPGGREPLPTPSERHDLETAPTGESEVIVEGVLCPRGHFNHPEIAYCNICGIGFNQISHVLVPRPRPPLGVLVLDDGTTFSLDADYVVGREPGNDPDVRSGTLRPLTLPDATQAVSRVHAQIVTRGWEVVVLDRGSSNGTYVAVPSSPAWQRLAPGQQLPLPSGSRLMLGSRSMTFQSHHLPA